MRTNFTFQKQMNFLLSVIALCLFFFFPLITYAQVTKRLYTIGNSLTDAINHKGLQVLAESRDNTHIWGKLARSGAPLGYIWQVQETEGVTQPPYSYPKQAFVNYQWDAITIQPFASSLDDDAYYIDLFVNLANTINAGSQYYIYMQYPLMPNNYTSLAECTMCDAALWNTMFARTSAQSNRGKVYFEDLRNLVNTQINPAKSFLIIPLGEVFKKLNDKMAQGLIPNYNNIWEIYADGVHVNNIGSYIKACTFFATIYGQDPRGLGVPSQYYTINQNLVNIIQETVWEVVTTYPYSGVTDVPVTGVNIIPNGITTSIGQQIAIQAEILPNNASNKGWQWTSSNPLVATVSGTGVVTTLGTGATTITVKTTNGNFQDNVIINVNSGSVVNVASVSINPTSKTLSVGSIQQLTADVLPTNATNKAVSFTSDNPTVASVDANGLVTAVSTGNANITVTTADGNKTAFSAISVIPNSPPVAILNASNLNGFAPLTVNFNALGSYDPDANDYILGYDWDFGGTEGKSVNNAPTHIYTQAGQYEVSLRVLDNKNLYGNIVTKTITVNPLLRTVTLNNETGMGNYYDIHIEAGGVLTLSGNINVQGTLRVKNGGKVIFNNFTLTGTGSFVLEDGGSIEIYKAEGITTTGVGDIQVAGTKTFATDATYIYKGAVAQETGNALPNTILNLEINNNQNVTLTNNLSIKRMIDLKNGNLISNGKLTLLSNATQTAMIIQKVDGSNQVVGNATVQRHVTGHPNGFQGIGYHYFSSPLKNGKVSEFADDMSLILNPNYDFVNPYSGAFPNVFRYNESKVQATAPANIFEKGWESPANENEALTPMRGYIANIQNGATVDFTGELNNGEIKTKLSRGLSPNSGWQLVGNPYPAPISWTNVVMKNPKIEGAVLRRVPTGQYAGTWASFVNGVGQNGGTDEIPVAQGFFVRANEDNIDFLMNNEVRLINYQNPTFYRVEETENAKKEGLIKLEVSQGKLKDETAIYFESGATESFDFRYDAERTQYNSGQMPSLFSISKDNKNLAINGLPSFSEDFQIPLTLYTYTNGKYTFKLNELRFFKNNVQIFIEDKLTGKVHNIRQNTEYEFDIAVAGFIKDRFVLRFTNKVTASNVLETFTVFPNPSSGEVNLRVFTEYRGEVAVNVYDMSGRVRKSLTINKVSSIYETRIDLQGLESGIYMIEMIDSKGNREAKRWVKM